MPAVGIFLVKCLNVANFTFRVYQNPVMKNKTINTILIIFVTAMLVTLAFFVRLGATADNVVILQTADITRAGCFDDIEKTLQAKEGIASTEVDANVGRVIVGFDSKKIRPDEIAVIISGLGYRNNVSEVLSKEEFRAKTGREPGTNMRTIGCAGGCGTREAKGE
jgi:copper chaperone CopZ